MNKKYGTNLPPIPENRRMVVHNDLHEYPPSEAVNEHAELEVANELIGRKEIGQQNNNL
ncbi:hypothetical protein [Bacillus thermotolerans]|uniref:hypothetical protein n=1 Tax=Bacillus thermotolerans TaxID=1221996 RepID=UPI000583CFBB|nr:hypothetical protein [Bacillus thermotolerans]KKB37114.1 hypothetical protein QY97_00488 [Bacillus thermotolerans]